MAVIGAGYWGPNIVRNALAFRATDLKWVCDRDVGRARHVVGEQSSIRVTPDIDDVLADESVEAVAIATPPATHAALAFRCVEAGRHLLVEKPLADSYDAGLQMVRAAEERGVVLHCDHTFCYTPAVQKIRDLVAGGELGTPLYYDSVRVNLGLVQEEVDVFWDLAPHDISIVDFILGSGRELLTVTAEGADPLGLGHACVGYLTMRFSDGLLAHCHLNWLSPTKIRTTIVGGSERMVVWNDLLPAQRVSVFESGVDLAEIRPLAGRAAPPQGVLPNRQHGRAGAPRAGGAARSAGGLDRRDPQRSRADDGWSRRPPGPARAGGGAGIAVRWLRSRAPGIDGGVA